MRILELADIRQGDPNYYFVTGARGYLLACPICVTETYHNCPHPVAEMREHLLGAENAQPIVINGGSHAQPSLAGDRDARKAMPMFDGLVGYFPNACAYVSHVSAKTNEQHNPGEPMHWAADKSIGTGNEIIRHLCERGGIDSDGIRHTGKVAWRALELLERELLNADPTLKPGVNVRNFTRESAKQKEAK